MAKKIIFLFFVFIFLFLPSVFVFSTVCKTDRDCKRNEVCREGKCVLAYGCRTDKDCPANKVCVEGKCVLARALEVDYPKVEGLPTLKTVAVGLPDYIVYIFGFLVIITGFIIFGVLIYNGIIYLTSVGNPTRLSEAKTGILAGFLGALILLGAYLIFHTINPQLVMIDPRELDPLEAHIRSGVYICQRPVADIEGIIKNYTQKGEIKKDEIRRNEAARKLREAIGRGKDINCFRISRSGKFRNFEVKRGRIYTMFTIPYENPLKEGDDRWEYNEAVIFREKSEFTHEESKCKIWPRKGEQIFRQIDGHKVSLDFNAKSVILVRRPAVPPIGEGVTLYSEIAYNEFGPLVEEILEEENTGEGGKTKEELREEAGKEGEKARKEKEEAEKQLGVCGAQNAWPCGREGDIRYCPISCPEDKVPDCDWYYVGADNIIGIGIASACKCKRDRKCLLPEDKRPPKDKLPPPPPVEQLIENTFTVTEGKDLNEVTKDRLGKLFQNASSMKIDPKPGYLAVLIGEGGEKCSVRWKNDANLTDNPIGRCGRCRMLRVHGHEVAVDRPGIIGGECYPCLETLIIINAIRI